MNTKTLILLAFILPLGLSAQNLKKAFKNLQSGKYTEARVLFNQSINDVGSKSAAYYGLATINSTKGQPGYDLFKAFEQINISKSSFDAMDAKTLSKISDYFNKEMIDNRLKKIDDDLFVYLKDKKSEDLVRRYLKECKTSSHYKEVTDYLHQLAFQKAEGFNTEAAYREFIKNFPDADEVIVAKQRINELAWEKAQKENTVESYAFFIEHYSEAPQISDAQTKLLDLEYQKAISKGSDAALLYFIKKYPNTSQAAELQARREKTAYDKAKRFNVLNVYQKFINDFPHSAYTAEITQYRDSLAFLEARKANTPQAYLNFVNSYPNARQVPQAMELLGNMSFSKAELAAMKKKKRIQDLKIHRITAFRVENNDTLIEVMVEYDSLGNKLVDVSQPGKNLITRIENTYDPEGELLLNRKVFVNGKLQKESEFKYFNEGLVKTETVNCYFDCGKYPEKYVSKYFYDSKRNLVRKVDSSLVSPQIIAEHSCQYNDKGLLVLQDINYSDSTNQSTTYRYDAHEWLMEKNTVDGAAKVLEVISYTYDSKGRKTSEKKFNAIGTIEHKYTYDEGGLLQSDEVSLNGEKINLIYRYEFY